MPDVGVETSGMTLLFEGDFAPAEIREIARSNLQDVVKVTSASLDNVCQTIADAASVLKSYFDDLRGTDGGSLSSAEVELAVKVGAEGSIVVAKGSAEGCIRVKLTWNFDSKTG